MSMLKKFKSLFVVEKKNPADLPTVDDASLTPPVVTTNDSSNDPTFIVPTTLSWDLGVDLDDKKNLPKNQLATPPATALTGVISDQHLEELMEVLEKHNLPGFDYLEFRHVMRLSENSNSDEQTRYESALTLAKSMGRDANQLLQDAQHYLQVIAQQSQTFEQSVLVSITKEIGDIEQKINELLADTAAKEAQIEQLKLAISNNQQVIDALKTQATQTAMRIESDKADFSASCKLVQDQINTDIQKLNQYKPI